MPHLPYRLLASLIVVAGLVSPAWADVTRVAITSRTVVANGQWFGAAGPYEKIAGTVFFELDPSDPHNKAIVDIDLAPRNARGRVEFSADLFILAPQDPSRASGSVLFEISNRGGKGLLTTFNRATPSADPMQPEHFGDGLLMRNGITLVWVGWEFDVPGISVKPPTATRNGSPIVETIAALAVVDARATEVSFSDVPLYPPVDPNDETATLTVRDTVWEKPAPLPRRGWQFVPPSPNAGGRCAGDAKCPRISMAAGFEPGRIYELKYRASNPPVSGVGLAAIRDVASAVKYGNGAIVPARGRYLHVYGASQSGRFLRLFLYDGFNSDEKGRKVFDGVMPHIAGAARSDFNTRFSQAVGLDQFGALKFPFTDASATRRGYWPHRRIARKIRRTGIAAEHHLYEFVGRVLGHGPRGRAHSHINRRQDGSDVAGQCARLSLRRHAARPGGVSPASGAWHGSECAGRRRPAAESDAAHDRFARGVHGARSLGPRRCRTAGQQVSQTLGRDAGAGRELEVAVPERRRIAEDHPGAATRGG